MDFSEQPTTELEAKRLTTAYLLAKVEVGGDSKFEMGDGKRPLEVRGRRSNAGTLKNSTIVQNAISLFPICCHFQILHNTQTRHSKGT